MTGEDRALLLGIARGAIEAAAHGRPPPPTPVPLPPALAAQGAAFVTIYCDGDLRGCIGHVEAVEPLWKSVQDMALAAAERDPRFPAILPEELPRLALNVSVLSPMRRVRPDEVQVGVHGLYLRKDGAAGLLLPQVAVEWGWDRAEFLRQICRKAGLPPDAFLDPAAELSVFTADVFGEGDVTAPRS